MHDEYSAAQRQLSDRLQDAYQQIDFVDPATGASTGYRANAAPCEHTARIDLIDGRVSPVLDRLTRWGIADATTDAQIALNDRAVSYTALNDLDDDAIAEAAYIAAREMSDLTNAQARQEARQLLQVWRTRVGTEGGKVERKSTVPTGYNERRPTT